MRISDWSSDVCSSDLRAPENTAKPPPATHIPFQPTTPAKSYTPRHSKSINRHSLSASATPCQPQSVSPIADRHTRIARDRIGTRCAYIPLHVRLSHGCRRTEAVGATRHVKFKPLLGDTP